MLSTFWQVWIMAIVFGSMAGCGVLIVYSMRGHRKEETTQTTGHEYDGIEEYDNPLPRWWVYMFWATIVFGFGYVGLYGLGNFDGFLTVKVDGEPVTWTSTNQWKAEVQAYDEKLAPLFDGYLATPVAELAKNEEALQTGQRLFKSNCSVCHGTSAMGAQGFPNLTDHDWLYGGSPEKIKETIMYGRQGAMPAWQAVLGDEGVIEMAEYVRSLSGLPHDAEAAEKAAPAFAQNCSVCHGADGKGNQLVGAPNLTDDIWLYGGSTKQIQFTLRNGRAGKMPAQKEILGEDKVHVLAAYIYSLSQN
ncbi:MAG: cytochrome-c oxidase, cbb3-type subunit III [Oceanospirillaceae bacterium]|nr:cytochrome-c oxidase, cbb3-type subunit III [Oceanospirillaceae bacterium]|tara:strand:- start:54777 stop:55688 length:912 start_codon:yes stop_codon:yes gene_type:complete